MHHVQLQVFQQLLQLALGKTLQNIAQPTWQQALLGQLFILLLVDYMPNKDLKINS
jgi:hypothetical protein